MKTTSVGKKGEKNDLNDKNDLNSQPVISTSNDTIVIVKHSSNKDVIFNSNCKVLRNYNNIVIVILTLFLRFIFYWNAFEKNAILLKVKE